MSADDHGSASTYRNHRCRCEDCRRAHASAMLSLRAARARLLRDDPSRVRHGRYTTYTNDGCRCLPCTEAMRLYYWDLRARRRSA